MDPKAASEPGTRTNPRADLHTVPVPQPMPTPAPDPESPVETGGPTNTVPVRDTASRAAAVVTVLALALAVTSFRGPHLRPLSLARALSVEHFESQAVQPVIEDGLQLVIAPRHRGCGSCWTAGGHPRTSGNL
ncbi:hypothetical protein AURDEDRAFT_174579 [Auricularia subglabra TFB-10046 SS5]|uniref:Uncharacterized protein n=1 Tax=Auricularia subglabra (strain TFB-10046 / SS5) TaxID=717982 RepID=J0CYK7_AURST|nr:hypothetical protein AURDEDRAFT_174579 [Auricularia subglabra TFB-10046 SS5]